MLARVCVIPLFAGLLTLSGCGPAKLEVNKTKTIEAADYDLIGLQKQSQDQKITIDVDATEPVNVLVIDASAEKGFENLSPAEQEAKAKYGKKKGVKKDAVTADVPANTAVTVAIGGGTKKSEVKISISNRK